MYCINCGKENNNGQALCDECLKKLNSPFAEDAEKVQESQVASEIKPEPVIPEKTEQEKLADEYQAFVNGTEIKPEPQPAYQPAPTIQPYQPNNDMPSTKQQIMYGFGLGLAGIILALVAFEFAYIGIIEFDYDTMMASGILAFLCSVPSLVFSIISLVRSGRRTSLGYKKPIPAFIFGLVGTILDGINLFLVFIILVM